MDGDDVARLAYLLLLASALAGWLIIESRGRMGQMARQALAWVLIFVGVAAAYGLWQDMDLVGGRQKVMAEGEKVELTRAPDQHFYLTLQVGDVPIRFMVDTGASSIVLSDRDTDRLKIDRASLAYLGSARTANGTIRTARVTLRDVSLEGEALGDFPAYVGDGPLDISLLGLDFLNRFQSVEIARDRLILTR